MIRSLAGAYRQEQTKKAPLSWRIRNALRWSYIWGLITVWLAIRFSHITGIVTITSQLAIKLYHKGEWIDYGVVCRRVVTNNGVGFLVDAWQNIVEIENMKYMGCGTGTNAENVADSALQTESTTALNPDSTRATGTFSEPAANQITITGTVLFDASAAITEQGVFSQAATGGGVLFDRSVFGAINAVSGDGIQFAYTGTFTAGS